MKNVLLDNIFKLKNRKDIDTYVENLIPLIKSGEILYPQAYYLEAMYLYNMYLHAMEMSDCEGYLYPYKLRKMIEIANELNPSKPTFSKATRFYTYNGTFKLSQLNETLEVLINYANITYICKVLNYLLPHIEKIPVSENFYIAIALMKLNGIELPPRIGQYITVDYIRLCGEQDFYKSARDRIKKVIALETLPLKAKAMYFQLPSLYKSLEESAIFDFGSISLQCFKIIEQTMKDLLENIFKGKTSNEVYEILPEDLKSKYKKESFKLNRLELGKITYLLEDLFDKNDTLSNILKEKFKDEDTVNIFLNYINIKNINKYRNPPAHGDYLPQELADEAMQIMNGFIYEAMYRYNKNNS